MATIDTLLRSLLINAFAPSDTDDRKSTTSDTTLPYIIFKNETHICVQVEMPGFDKQSINVDLLNNQLTVTGIKTQSLLDKFKIRSSIVYGKFTQVISLPVGIFDRQSITVAYDSGVLTIAIVLPTESERISINVGDMRV